MKAVRQVFVEKFFGRHLDLRERLFNLLAKMCIRDRVKVIVDATADTRSESITAVELTEDDQDLPVYITTVRVHEDGTKERCV